MRVTVRDQRDVRDLKDRRDRQGSPRLRDLREPVPDQPAEAGVPSRARPDTAAGRATGSQVATAAGGATIWLTGLPSAGKSTIASALAARLRQAGRQVEVLDGDELRATISAGLGFSRADRDTAVRRAGTIAAMLARHGVLVLAPLVSPYRAARDQVRDAHRAQHVPFLEVHVATGVRTCAARDVKGLYARQRAGSLHGLSGVDDPYEPPADPELRLDTAGRPVDHCVRTVLDLLQSKGLA